MQDFLDILLHQLMSSVLVAYLHGIVGVEPLNVQVGRVLVFERLVDYSVILLFHQLYPADLEAEADIPWQVHKGYRSSSDGNRTDEHRIRS